ncbi:MAG TPA: peptidylprolyl isomerase [Salinimicrobium sp.]|nr:peptidylprolyl isomerase [Salinimicrobium sp.]
MAVLNKIRQRSVFLIIIIALALFSFVLADVIRSGGFSSQKSQSTIATVNGEDIEREDFARQVEFVQQNSGGNMTTTQAVKTVWEERIKQMVLEEELDELGIQVEQSQIKQLLAERLQGNPNFVDEEGFFDENRLQEYVATIKSTSPAAYQQWLDFENSVAQSAREQIYINMVMAGMGSTLKEGERAYRLANDKVDLEFVQIPFTTIPDSEVEVSKEEIQSYIKAHPEKYKTEASRDIQYVYLPEKASTADDEEVRARVSKLLEDKVEFNNVSKTNDTVPGFANTEKIEEFVNQNSDVQYNDRFLFEKDLPKDYAPKLSTLEVGEVFGPYKDGNSWKISKVVEIKEMPDSAKASHILIAYDGTQTATSDLNRSKEEARILADSILTVVKSDKDMFSELAAKYSSDPSNKDNGGDLDYFPQGRMVPPFNDFVFENEKGDMGVVETRFGFHVISIDDQTEKEKAWKLATIVQPVEASEKSLQDLFRETTKFEIAAKEGDFSEAAKETGEPVRQVKGIGELEESIQGLGSQRALVQWAFNEETEVGDIKRFDYSGGYVVAQVTAVNDSGLMSVEDASATVTPILRKQKKAEIIKEKIAKKSMSEIASANGVSIQTANAVNMENPTLVGAGREPMIVGAAFGLEEEKVSAPIAGEKGVYVIKVTKKTAAPDLPNYRSYAMLETQANRTSARERVLEALKNSAEIEDNRANFY